MSTDDPQRQQRRDLGDEVALALRGDGVDDLGGLRLDVAAEPGQRARRERLRHDAAQPGVARVVHVDHRAEELGEERRHVEDAGALARAEEVGVAAGLDHVAVAGDRPEAGAARP